MTGARALPPTAADTGFIVPDWPAPPRVRAWSTTRWGGVSEGPYASLNLALSTARRAGGDRVEAVAENRRRLGRHLPSAPVWLDQVHGASVTQVGPDDAARLRVSPPVADAAVTRERDVVLAVLAADCLPVLLADRHGRAIGVAHAGWRGLAQRIVENTVAAMAVAPADVVAWLGPAIGPAAFEVGAEVRLAFVGSDPDSTDCFLPGAPGKWTADLYALARRSLARAGVTEVHGGGFCTHTDAARFFSYRRDRETGRMATVIWLTPGPAGQ